MLKLLAIAATLFLLMTDARTQIVVGLWTDRATYGVGDTITFHITAYNPTKYPILLHFGSGCQVSYKIDDFDLKSTLLCPAILTARSVPPLTTVSWDYLEYPKWGGPELAPGVHTLIGEVLGYGTSPPMQITVTPTTSVSIEHGVIADYHLGNNYPNPFNGSTSITYSVSTPGDIRLGIYDGLGRLVRILEDGYSPVGEYQLTIDLSDQPSGVYWCRFQHKEKVQTTKLILSK